MLIRVLVLLLWVAAPALLFIDVDRLGRWGILCSIAGLGLGLWQRFRTVDRAANEVERMAMQHVLRGRDRSGR